MARVARAGARQTFLRTRYFLCQTCALQHKACRPQKLRLDTIRQTLICSNCSNTNVISIDMIGRVLRYKSQSFMLCPGCVRIHPYGGQADLSAWFLDHCGHPELVPPHKALTTRSLCTVCSEPATQHRTELVDHHTGEIRRFSFCQRHTPRHDELARCHNARQLLDRFGQSE